MDEALAQLLQAPHIDASHLAGRASAALLLDAVRAGEPVILVAGQSDGGASRLLSAALASLGPGDPRVIRLSPPFPTVRGVQRRLQALLDGHAGETLAEPAQVAQSLLLLEAPAPGVAPVMIAVDGIESASEPLLRYLWLMHSLTSLGRVTLQLVLTGQDAASGQDSASGQEGGEGALAAPSLAGLRAAVSLRLTVPRPSTTLDLPSMGEVLAASLQRGDLAPLPVAGAPPGRPPGRSVPSRPHRRRAAAAGAAACLAVVGLAAWRLGSRHSSHPGSPDRPATAAVAARRIETRGLAAAARSITPRQAAFELASLQQPPAWLPALPHGQAASAVPAPRAMPQALLAPPPAKLPSPGALPPLGPVRVSVPPLPPGVRGTAPDSAPTPLLVIADATVPKVTVVFGLGDAPGLAQATLAVRRLRQDGLPVADAQAMARPVPRPGIGYFFLADRPGAELVAHALAPMLASASVQMLPMPADPPAPGAVRVVIGSR